VSIAVTIAPSGWRQPRTAHQTHSANRIGQGRRFETTIRPHWVYLDIGKFGGLVESWGESIKYPIYTTKDEDKNREGVILAGPTCDSADILYEKFRYQLPLSLKTVDLTYLVGTGAHTTTYSAIEFNGFPPLTAKFYDSEE